MSIIFQDLENAIQRSINDLTSESETGQPLGLFNGKVGLSILFNIIYRYTGEEKWNLKVGKLIEEVTNDLGLTENFDYADGYTGIGWCIEWLVQNHSFEANTDVILEDFDDSIYKVVLYSLDKNISLKNGALGKCLYFLKRMDGLNYKTHRFKVICIQECLVILTDEILLNIREVIHVLRTNWMNSELLMNLAHALIFLSKFVQRKINIEAVEEALYLAVDCAKMILNNSIKDGDFILISNELKISVVMLSYAYQFAGIKLYMRDWIKEGTYFINKFLKFLLGSTYPHERLSCLPILARQFHLQNDELFVQYILNDIQKLEFPAIENRLNNGKYEILLSAISCIKKDYLSWDEALLFS